MRDVCASYSSPSCGQRERRLERKGDNFYRWERRFGQFAGVGGSKSIEGTGTRKS